MSPSKRTHAVEVLKAVSSPIRLNILNLLLERSLLSYTELMEGLKMDPSRDAGRFAYHLKVLLKADLVEADADTKKYRLTRMGKMVVDVAGEIEKKASERRRVLVRTSRFSLEDFDTHKIVNSLTEEADMPVDTARKVAKKAEKRVIKSKTKYLTAPLIREVVNAVLIEEGLERYRHKLTRLGLPVYDAASLVQEKSKRCQGSASIKEEAGKVVLQEYTLLNMLPRDIADAHLSGSLFINGLSSWTLTPTEVIHDLRFFLQNGLNLQKMAVFHSSYPPPKTLESALSLICDVLLHSGGEVDDTQTLAYFNIFLAPFIKDLIPSKVKGIIRPYLRSISQHTDASLGLELVTPDFIAQKEAIASSGKVVGNYGDFRDETQLLASLILEVFAEESERNPLFNPKIVVKIRPETFDDGEAKELLSKAHQLALQRGTPYFANLIGKKRRQDVFSASGFRLKADFKKDWEIDTLRAGNIGYVAVNLPRITYECEEDEPRFFEILGERLEMAERALEIKYRTLRRQGKGLLPFMTQKTDGDYYFRLGCSSGLITMVGVQEAAEMFCGQSISEDGEPLQFAERITEYVSDFTDKTQKQQGNRLLPAVLPSLEGSKRLVNMDMERYGRARVRFSGTRENPFYSTVSTLNLQDKENYLKHLGLHSKLRGLHAGGNLTVVPLGKGEPDPDEVMSWSRRLVQKFGIDFFTYHRDLTYCRNCQKSWCGLLHKCPSCQSTSTLTALDKYYRLSAL